MDEQQANAKCFLHGLISPKAKFSCADHQHCLLSGLLSGGSPQFRLCGIWRKHANSMYACTLSTVSLALGALVDSIRREASFCGLHKEERATALVQQFIKCKLACGPLPYCLDSFLEVWNEEEILVSGDHDRDEIKAHNDALRRQCGVDALVHVESLFLEHFGDAAHHGMARSFRCIVQWNKLVAEAEQRGGGDGAAHLPEMSDAQFRALCDDDWLQERILLGRRWLSSCASADLLLCSHMSDIAAQHVQKSQRAMTRFSSPTRYFSNVFGVARACLRTLVANVDMHLMVHAPLVDLYDAKDDKHMFRFRRLFFPDSPSAQRSDVLDLLGDVLCTVQEFESMRNYDEDRVFRLFALRAAAALIGGNEDQRGGGHANPIVDEVVRTAKSGVELNEQTRLIRLTRGGEQSQRRSMREFARDLHELFTGDDDAPPDRLLYATDTEMEGEQRGAAEAFADGLLGVTFDAERRQRVAFPAVVAALSTNNLFDLAHYSSIARRCGVRVWQPDLYAKTYVAPNLVHTLHHEDGNGTQVGTHTSLYSAEPHMRTKFLECCGAENVFASRGDDRESHADADDAGAADGQRAKRRRRGGSGNEVVKIYLDEANSPHLRYLGEQLQVIDCFADTRCERDDAAGAGAHAKQRNYERVAKLSGTTPRTLDVEQINECGPDEMFVPTLPHALSKEEVEAALNDDDDDDDASGAPPRRTSRQVEAERAIAFARDIVQRQTSLPQVPASCDGGAPTSAWVESLSGIAATQQQLLPPRHCCVLPAGCIHAFVKMIAGSPWSPSSFSAAAQAMVDQNGALSLNEAKTRLERIFQSYWRHVVKDPSSTFASLQASYAGDSAVLGLDRHSVHDSLAYLLACTRATAALTVRYEHFQAQALLDPLSTPSVPRASEYAIVESHLYHMLTFDRDALLAPSQSARRSPIERRRSSPFAGLHAEHLAGTLPHLQRMVIRDRHIEEQFVYGGDECGLRVDALDEDLQGEEFACTLCGFVACNALLVALIARSDDDVERVHSMVQHDEKRGRLVCDCSVFRASEHTTGALLPIVCVECAVSRGGQLNDHLYGYGWQWPLVYDAQANEVRRVEEKVRKECMAKIEKRLKERATDILNRMGEYRRATPHEAPMCVLAPFYRYTIPSALVPKLAEARSFLGALGIDEVVETEDNVREQCVARENTWCSWRDDLHSERERQNELRRARVRQQKKRAKK